MPAQRPRNPCLFGARCQPGPRWHWANPPAGGERARGPAHRPEAENGYLGCEVGKDGGNAGFLRGGWVVKAPVCKNCGVSEWRHVCGPLGVSKAVAGAAGRAAKVAEKIEPAVPDAVTGAVTYKKSVTPAVTLPVAGCCPTCGKPVGRTAAQRKADERARKKVMI